MILNYLVGLFFDDFDDFDDINIKIVQLNLYERLICYVLKLKLNKGKFLKKETKVLFLIISSLNS